MKRTLTAAVGIAVCAIAGVVVASPAMAQEPGANDATITEIDLSGFENLDSYLNAVATAPGEAPSPLPPAAPVEPVVDVVDAKASVGSVGAERGAVTLPAAGSGHEQGASGDGLLVVLLAAAALLSGGVAIQTIISRRN